MVRIVVGRTQPRGPRRTPLDLIEIRSTPQATHAPVRLGPDAAEVWRDFHEVEAHMARSMLESNGIDAVVWSAGVGANVPFDDTIAHRVMVRADDAQEARKLVAATPPA